MERLCQKGGLDLDLPRKVIPIKVIWIGNGLDVQVWTGLMRVYVALLEVAADAYDTCYTDL